MTAWWATVSRRESSSLTIGPISFLDLDLREAEEIDLSYFEPNSVGEYEGIKHVVVVSDEAVGPVLIEIDNDSISAARLLYDPNRRGALEARAWRQNGRI